MPRLAFLLVSGAALLAGCSSSPAVVADDVRLTALFEQDQSDRRTVDDVDWTIVEQRDAERRREVAQMLERGAVRTAADHYHAAMIFQHGDSAEEIRLAHAFATISAALGSSSASNWLMAASWDRLMLQFEQPQWYGTQYVRDNSGKWVLYEVDPDAVTDEQRAERSVPSLQESRERAELMNGSSR